MLFRINNYISYLVIFFAVILISGCNDKLRKSKWYRQGKPTPNKSAISSSYVPRPWIPLSLDKEKETIQCWGRKYNFSGKSFLFDVHSKEESIFNGPAEILAKSKDEDKFERIILDKIAYKKVEDGRIIFTKSSTKNSKISIEYTIEYDGFVWIELKLKEQYSALKLVIPIVSDVGELIHYVGAPTNLYSQSLPSNSYSQSLPSKNGSLWSSPFKTMVWVGNNDKGITWFSESQRGWHPKNNSNAIRIIREESTCKLEINFITTTNPCDEDSGKISFGLMATPVKPIPDDWRQHSISAQYRGFTGKIRGSMVVYWPDEWRTFSIDPDPTYIKNETTLKQRIFKDKNESRKIIPYFSKLTNVLYDEGLPNPNGKKMYDQWATKPNYRLSESAKSYRYRVAPNTRWADYLVWCVSQWQKKVAKVDGIYVDELQPVPNTNPVSNGGYEACDKRYPTWDILGSRNLFKRTTSVIQENTKELPYSIAHCSGTNIIPYLSHFNVFLTGEQFFSGYFKYKKELIPPKGEELYYYSYALPLDRLRAEGYGKQWGAIMAFLPCLKNQKGIVNNPISTRDMLSKVLQMDMLIWPLWCNRNEVETVTGLREDFCGIDKVDFIPYWDNELFKINDEDIKIGYYKKDDEFLLVISNLARKRKNVTLDFPFTVRNFQFMNGNKNTLKISTENIDKVQLNLLRNDFIILKFKK